MVYSQLESAGEMFFMLSMIDASIDRVEEINQSPQIDIDGKEQTPDRLDIEMQDVSFSYGDKKVIDHVSLTIPQGTTTAIVGPSGSGKTTLVNLIARFWDVDSGSVRIGGIDVKDYKLDSLMKNISMVLPQDKELETALFHRMNAKRCAVCRALFTPGSNRAKYCPECAARMKRVNAAKRKRKQREKCHALGDEKPL